MGLSREDARRAVIDWFDAQGLLEEVRPYTHSVGHSYRSHVPIEPWLSDQWYVAVTDDRLRGSALRALDPDQAPQLPDDVPLRGDTTGDGQLRFHPRPLRPHLPRLARHHPRLVHLAPAVVGSPDPGVGADPAACRRPSRGAPRLSARPKATTVSPSPRAGSTPVPHTWCGASPTTPSRRRCACRRARRFAASPRADDSLDEDSLVAALEADGFTRDPDVLDTWFSSGLWPLSTMGWPWPADFPETVGLLDAFNPTSVLSTAREIITLWVSRMVMFNRYFRAGTLPFTDVFIHAMVQDGHGQKMSKSLGNGVDPRDIIHSHGADAMRYTLVQMTTDTQDVRMPVDLVCPHTGQAFTPEVITTSAGHVVTAPVQRSPGDPTKEMVTAFGVATGAVTPTAERPLARNSSAKFDLGRNFANKLWNATRFALRRLDGTTAGDDVVVGAADARFVDRWILARLHETVATLERALRNYQFNVYADTLYDFVWRDVCDRYLEAVKPTIDDDPTQQVVLGAVLDAVLRIMHPVCPFVTEALWPAVSEARHGHIDGLELPPAPLLAGAAWPVVADRLGDRDVVDTFDRGDTLAAMIRTLRAERNVAPRKEVTVHAPAGVRQLIAACGGAVETLAGVSAVLASEGERPGGGQSAGLRGCRGADLRGWSTSSTPTSSGPAWRRSSKPRPSRSRASRVVWPTRATSTTPSPNWSTRPGRCSTRPVPTWPRPSRPWPRWADGRFGGSDVDRTDPPGAGCPSTSTCRGAWRSSPARWTAGVEATWTDQPGGTGAMIAALAAGEVDVVSILTEGTVAAIADGLAATIVQTYVASPLQWGVHVPAGSDLTEIDDCAGRRVAISRRLSGSHLMAHVQADRHGWQLEESRFVLVGGLGRRSEGVRRGRGRRVPVGSLHDPAAGRRRRVPPSGGGADAVAGVRHRGAHRHPVGSHDRGRHHRRRRGGRGHGPAPPVRSHRVGRRSLRPRHCDGRGLVRHHRVRPQGRSRPADAGRLRRGPGERHGVEPRLTPAIRSGQGSSPSAGASATVPTG